MNGHCFKGLNPVYGTAQSSTGLTSSQVSGQGLLRTMNLLVEMDSNRTVMRPHFEKMLSIDKITAWVCSNQTLSVAAEEFLKANRVRIPLDLNLIGIDTDHACMLRRITTYDFRKDRLGYIAAHCLIGDLPFRRKQNGLVDVPGEIVVRETTGRCPEVKS
jgi:DNA-binding LacI/PurR family transcriptional regulator